MKSINLRSERGVGMLEYALILVLMGVAVTGVLLVTGVGLRGVYCQVIGMFYLSDACRSQASQAPGHLAFDDFSNLDNWDAVRIRAEAEGRWRAVGGNAVANGAAGIFMSDFTGTDYAYTVDGATLRSGAGYGLMFRTSNADQALNGYAFQYDHSISSSGGFAFKKWVNGYEVATLGYVPWTGSLASFANNTNAPHQVQVVAQGNTFAAFVDGRQVLTAADSTWAQGGVGLRTWGSDNTNASIGAVAVDPLSGAP